MRMSSSIDITVLLCTYNRSQRLGETLESLVFQSLPESLCWEILVVDNNSADETRQVVEGFQRRYQNRVRYLFEPKQGISHARNAAIREAAGDILAFIDDDETATPNWLQNLTMNLHSDEWAGAGGRVLPPSSFSPPPWLLKTSWFAAGPLASFDKGLDGAELREPPFGANMAFRKEVFTKLGGFRIDLGRSGANMISNEDTEFGRRVLAAGLRIRYEPSALIYHPVEERRLRKDYFLSWWFNKGRSDSRERGNQPDGKSFFGISSRGFRSLVAEAVSWTVAVEPSRRFGHKLAVWNSAGQIYESYHQWLDVRRKGQERPPGIGPSGRVGS
jgi:glucosyl-dolichyl phosphate glucuronosyltransferase